MPDGSNGHRRASRYPVLPHRDLLDMSGKRNFNKAALMEISVNWSNQIGAVLNISVNLADASSSAMIIGRSC